MIFSGVNYTITRMKRTNKKISVDTVKQSMSSCLCNRKISKKEMVSRLHLADDIFYEDGEIQEIIIKTKIKGKIHKRIYTKYYDTNNLHAE